MIEILVVDGNPRDAILVRDFLSKKYGVQVTVAHDGPEALDLLLRPAYQPSLILLDLNIPKLDGQEVLRWMRRKLTFKVPIVILSSSQNRDRISHAYANGANIFIDRPSDLDALLKAVQGVARLWIEPLLSESKL